MINDNDYIEMATTFVYKQKQQWSIKYSNGFKFTEEKIINSYLYTYVYSRKKKINKTKIFNRRILTKV